MLTTGRLPLVALTAMVATAACSEATSSLVIELVPNPEVNTRANVTDRVNSLEFVLDVAGGFAGLEADEGDAWGPYEVSDVDGDQTLELILRRPGGSRALDPFALTRGSLEDQVLSISARGRGAATGPQVTALGGAAATFEADREVRVELPFNLVPAYRPLRVLSMTPAQGSQDLEPPVESVTIQLGGEVLDDALGVDGENVMLLAAEAGERLTPTVAVSYVDTAMGRLTNVRLLDCSLQGGVYEVVIEAGAICTTTGQCLDQHLGVEGAQPFAGHFTVRGDPVAPSCSAIEVQTLPGCPEAECQPGFDCVEGACVLDAQSLAAGETSLTCDPGLCAPPELICDPLGTCQADCRFFGACPLPEERCDADSGLCVHGDR